MFFGSVSELIHAGQKHGRWQRARCCSLWCWRWELRAVWSCSACSISPSVCLESSSSSVALVFACLVVIPSGTLVRGQVRDVTLCMNLCRSISILQLNLNKKRNQNPWMFLINCLRRLDAGISWDTGIFLVYSITTQRDVCSCTRVCNGISFLTPSHLCPLIRSGIIGRMMPSGLYSLMYGKLTEGWGI